MIRQGPRTLMNVKKKNANANVENNYIHNFIFRFQRPQLQ